MSKTILIVDDESKNMKLFCDLLQVSGYATIEAGSGSVAVALARKRKPNLILMDIQMPEMDGVKAVQIIKADDTVKHIPVVALTAFAMKGDEEKILDAGFNGYISKPIQIKKFLDMIEKHLLQETEA